MKKLKLFSTLALATGMMIGCQQDPVDVATPGSHAQKSLREVTDCTCVDSYEQLEPAMYENSGVTVEITNDASYIYYKVYRSDMSDIGNVFVEGVPVGQANSNVAEFFNVIAPDQQGCDTRSTNIRLTRNGSSISFLVSYKIVPLCPPNGNEECSSYNDETAFGGSMAGRGKAWWYYYLAGSGQQPIYAGQNRLAGHVTIDESGNFMIHLMDGWELKTDETESVKIQGYNTPPNSRPSAGKFRSYKGSSLTGNAGVATYYVVHLDLQRCTNTE